MPSVTQNASRALNNGNVLSGLIVALEILKDASSAVSAVPFLAGAVSAVLCMVKAIEKARGDKDRFLRLAQRAAALMEHVERNVSPDPRAIDDGLRLNLASLQTTLVIIQCDVERQVRKSWLKRTVCHASIADKLARHLEALDTAWRSFDTACLVVIRQKVEGQSHALHEQAQWGRDQLRLFRWADLQCRKVRGQWTVGYKTYGEEWEGEWAGRAVVIRVLRDEDGEKPGPADLVVGRPNVHYPHISQLLGYSHPSVPERFYVIESGSVPIMSRFQRTKGSAMARMNTWMQIVVEFQRAFYHLTSRKFPVGDPVGNKHKHTSKCLPSAALTTRGTLLVEAEDFQTANAGCIRSWLRKMHDEMFSIPWTEEDITHETNILKAEGVTLLQPRDEPVARPATMDEQIEFMMSKPTESWASYPASVATFGATARPGDYGYLDRTRGSAFVRIGSFRELARAREDASAAEEMLGCTEVVEVAHDDVAGETQNNTATERLRNSTRQYVRFFWDYSRDIARSVGVEVHDVALVSERIDVRACISDGGAGSLTTTHYHYVRLPVFEAELHHLFVEHRLRAGTGPKLAPHPIDASRIEEIASTDSESSPFH